MSQTVVITLSEPNVSFDIQSIDINPGDKREKVVYGMYKFKFYTELYVVQKAFKSIIMIKHYQLRGK